MVHACFVQSMNDATVIFMTQRFLCLNLSGNTLSHCLLQLNSGADPCTLAVSEVIVPDTLHYVIFICVIAN